MIEFILNNQKVKTALAEGTTLLDYIRKEHHLVGTKIGCREGDCGACTVLEGILDKGGVIYRSVVSCLTPLINVHGKHIVTIEGLNMDKLSPIQEAMSNRSATQCGFCTPGFVMSLTGHLLSCHHKDPIESISGNICRCTGYKSIEKAAHDIDEFKKSLNPANTLEDLVKKNGLPEYFLSIPKMLATIKVFKDSSSENRKIMGGGTDLLVQQPENIRKSKLKSSEKNIPNGIEIESGTLKVGAGISISDFFKNPFIKETFPQFNKFVSLIASEQIRNMGTLAGNIVNASPIGDLSVLFLALDVKLILETSEGAQRQIKLNEFFIDYKKTSLKDDEFISYIVLNSLQKDQRINFEKVSKRTYLDIASVNSAISISVKDGIIESIHLSAGGIAPVPKYFSKTKEYLNNKKLDAAVLKSAVKMLQEEVNPISDIRGSEEYKRLLLKQLFFEHFYKLFPDLFKAEDIHQLMCTNTFEL